MSIEIFIAFVSAFVAICALGVTIWQRRQNHKHNRLRVRPILTTTMEHDIETGFVAFHLTNSGVGPAIIKNFVLLFRDKEISRNNWETSDDFLKSKTKGFKDVFIGQYVPGAAMQVGENFLLLSFEYNPGKHKIEFIHHLNLLVDYQCIYQDKTFTYDSRKDRKFHG